LAVSDEFVVKERLFISRGVRDQNHKKVQFAPP